VIVPYIYPHYDPTDNWDTQNLDVMQCPSRVKSAWLDTGPDYDRYMYSMNHDLRGHYSSPWKWPDDRDPRRTTEFSYPPSDICYFVDCGMYFDAMHGAAINEYGLQGHPTLGQAPPPHEGRGVGITFADGHAVFWRNPTPYMAAPPHTAPWYYKNFWGVSGPRPSLGWRNAVQK